MADGNSTKSAKIVVWLLRIMLALAFFAAGAAKLGGADMMVGMFEKIGFGQWFRILTGSLEVIGAAAIIFPRTSHLGALLLAAIMAGAVATHLLLIGGSPAPAAGLLALSLVALFMQRGRFSGAASAA